VSTSGRSWLRASPRPYRQVRHRAERVDLHWSPARHPYRPRLPHRLPQSPRCCVHRAGSRLSAGTPTVRPAARRRVHLAQRWRARTSGRRVGRPQRRRAPAHLRQVHRWPARRRQAPHPRRDDGGKLSGRLGTAFANSQGRIRALERHFIYRKAQRLLAVSLLITGTHYLDDTIWPGYSGRFGSSKSAPPTTRRRRYGNRHHHYSHKS
jgi:hypothetical protein